MTHTPQNSAEVAVAIRPTLDQFVIGAIPAARKVADEVYEHLLYSVQDYLRENAEWNLGGEIDRCRAIEADSRALREVNSCLLEALERCLNFIANTEGEMGESLECGDLARAAIARARGDA